MTDHAAAIDRALERLDDECVIGYSGYLDKELARPILTDLAAEFEANVQMQARERPTVTEFRKLEARLAAVVEYAKECRTKKEPVDQMHVIALARGEGGSDEG